MNHSEQRVREDFEDFQNNPDVWKWAESDLNDKEVGEWLKIITAHFETIALPHIKKNKEAVVGIFPSQFVWGQESGYISGITTDRRYRVSYGEMGTGYLCITDKNAYILTFASLVKRYPVKKKPDFLVRLLWSIAGERDELEHSQNDHNWTIPLNSILDVQITQPEDGVECLTLITNAMTWDMHIGGTETLSYVQTAIIMAKEKRLTLIDGQGQQQTDIVLQDEVIRLRKIKTMLESGLITKGEYQTKKNEILSGL